MMPLATTIRGAALAALTLAIAGCSADRETGRPAAASTGIGAIGGQVSGYLLADVVGGRRERGARVARAGILPLASAGAGAYMNREERELRQRTQGTDVRVTRQGDDLLLDLPSGVTFAYDSADIALPFRRTLDQLAGTVARYRQTYVDVYGHTDAIGGDAYNQTLSERRAGAVAAYLEGGGVQAARIGTRGFGRTQPVAANETDEGRALNRRVEIRLVPVRQGDAG